MSSRSAKEMSQKVGVILKYLAPANLVGFLELCLLTVQVLKIGRPGLRQSLRHCHSLMHKSVVSVDTQGTDPDGTLRADDLARDHVVRGTGRLLSVIFGVSDRNNNRDIA